MKQSFFFSAFLLFSFFYQPLLKAQCSGTVLSLSATTSTQTGTWTVPSGWLYKVRVTTKGGKGGGSNFGNGGNGASIVGDFIVSGNQVLAGTAGSPGTSNTDGGTGGGGSAVQIQGGQFLEIAGGGGGGGLNAIGKGGTILANGTDGNNVSSYTAGQGGTSGGDGTNGFETSSSSQRGLGGKGVLNGFAGGLNGGSGSAAGGGGGGGFSGGGGLGGGGGSLNLGANKTNQDGVNSTGGVVSIECLGTATFSANISTTQPACGSLQGSLKIDLTSDNDGNTTGLEYAIVSGNTFTGTPTFSSITADPFSVSSGFGTTGAAGGNTYTVRIRLTYNSAIYTDKIYTLNANPIPGNPAVFGNKVWNVYAWNAGGLTFTGNTNCWNTNYAGFYTDNNLDVNTINNWGTYSSPSSATGYAGCPVRTDYMSFVAKRQGFTCGYYQLDIPSHDDGAQLLVNGTIVWSEDVFNSNNLVNVWTGWLGDSDKVELKVTEGGGEAFGRLHFNALTGNNGDPAVFGNNKWNIYAWNSGNGTIGGSNWTTNYVGYYTSTSQDINTVNDWDMNTSPSHAVGYQGCTVANDNHSYSAKRQGFACGYYKLDVPGHSHAGQLFVNGSKVWEHNGCCDSHTSVWSGWLGGNDKIEFRITDSVSESYGKLTLNLLRSVDTSTTNTSICTSQLPYTWNGNTCNTAGTYYAHFSSVKGCDSVSSLKLKIKITSSSDTTVTACKTYAWNGANYTSSGTYSWHGTGAGGCDSTARLHLTIPAIANTFSKTDAGCFNSATGSIQIQVANSGHVGTPPYTYRLGVTGLINSTTNVFNNLKAGSYRAYIQDANGCIGVAAPIVVAQQLEVSAVVSTTNLTCRNANDGKISVQNYVGNPPFMYQVGNTGSYRPFTPPLTFTGLAAGDYRIYLKDGTGCTGALPVATITQGNTMSVNYTVTPIACTGTRTGSITLSIVGSTNATFKLNPGGKYTSQTIYTGIAAGTYYGYAKDSGGCAIRSAPIVLSPATGCPNFARGAIANAGHENQNFEVSLSPNPSSHAFKLTAYTAKTEAIQLRVIDINGKVVYTAKGSPAQAFTFGEAFANGIYMVEVRQGDEVKTMKAVKIRN